MDVALLFLTSMIFLETSFLVLNKNRPRRGGGRKIYIDTSTLIDGRILDVARSGFLDGDIIVLKSVLRELQLLADGKDIEKRNRAREGLKNVAELERVLEINTEIVDDGEGRKLVDEELLKFAKANHGAVLTLDYNLIKVAEAEKIPTLNLNDLALAVKTDFIPGERIRLKILEKGSNKGQGVGHLANGVMVVVEKGGNKIGKTVEVELERFHETSSGRMFFAKIVK